MTAAISSMAQLAAVIRHQLAAQAPAGRVLTAKPANRKTVQQGDAQAERYAQENLGALIELRVKQIGHADPLRGRKAFRVFLEVVLASHFGPGMVNDPGFHQMVDDIQQAMEGHPECGQLVARAIKELLAESETR